MVHSFTEPRARTNSFQPSHAVMWWCPTSRVRGIECDGEEKMNMALKWYGVLSLPTICLVNGGRTAEPHNNSFMVHLSTKNIFRVLEKNSRSSHVWIQDSHVRCLSLQCCLSPPHFLSYCTVLLTTQRAHTPRNLYQK